MGQHFPDLQAKLMFQLNRSTTCRFHTVTDQMKFSIDDIIPMIFLQKCTMGYSCWTTFQ